MARSSAGGKRPSPTDLAAGGAESARKLPPRGRLWLNDESCVTLRPQWADHVWSYDFVAALTHEGRMLKILTLIDEYTRECMALRVGRRLVSYEVIETLADVMQQRAIPQHLRSDNGPESSPKSCVAD